MNKKIVTLFAAGTLLITLSACGNNDVATNKNSSDNEIRSSKIANNSNHSKNKHEAKLQSTKVKSAQTNSKSAGAYVVTKATDNSATVKPKSNAESRVMTETDAKNIVKEHILAKLNDAGIKGQPRPEVPSMDEIDGYSAVQNGTNDWTISGNGHVYHVTATSVTEQ